MDLKQTRMALTLVLMTLLATFSPAVTASEQATAFFLVRHAEKSDGGSDPPLSSAGQARSQQLAELLKDAAIDAIFSTDFHRSRDTAAPLARALGLELRLYDPAELEAFAADLVERGGRVLVVGHSNTTPELAQHLGGTPGSEIDEEKEYDRLYILTPRSDGTTTTVLLRYGKVFSP
jgi:broad specificity phosphatase PhoE